MTKQKRYFILANSFAAPFFSDTSTDYVEADSPREALEQFAAAYKHPAGLFAALAYSTADAYHGGDKPLARWLCNHEREKQRLTAGMGSYSYLGHEPGRFEINGVQHVVENPHGGSVSP